MRAVTVLVLIMILTAALGCGRKGPLYLPPPAEQETETE
jgi:predicted small lipoprotein YifL